LDECSTFEPLCANMLLKSNGRFNSISKPGFKVIRNVENVFSTCLKIGAAFWSFKILFLAVVSMTICIFLQHDVVSAGLHSIVTDESNLFLCFIRVSFDHLRWLSSVLVLWQQVAELYIYIYIYIYIYLV
jgi:hypothetical protein